MGYFTDINNSSERAQGVAEYNRANGVNGHTALGVIASQYGPSIFMSLTSKIASSSDGKGGSDSKELSIDEQKKSLEKQLDKALSAIGVDNIAAVDNAVSTQNDKVKAAQDNVDKFANGSDSYTKDITAKEGQKVSGSNLTEEQVKQNKNLDNEIKKLKAKREDAKKSAEKQLAKEIKIYQEMVVNADKAKNINTQLLQLKSIDDSNNVDPKYDVKQEVTDLSDFNKARENFLKKPSKETAEALKKSYDSIDTPNSYTKAAYKKHLEPRINKYLNN